MMRKKLARDLSSAPRSPEGFEEKEKEINKREAAWLASAVFC